MMRTSLKGLRIDSKYCGHFLLTAPTRSYRLRSPVIPGQTVFQNHYHASRGNLIASPSATLSSQCSEPLSPAVRRPQRDLLTVPELKPRTRSQATPHNWLPTVSLPVSCPGCGALSQETSPEEAGYYKRTQRTVYRYLRFLRDARDTPIRHVEPDKEDQTPEKVEDDEPSDTSPTQISYVGSQEEKALPDTVPVCMRCHDLIYHSKGTSIAHPSVEAIADSIAESPFRRNHVYHVVDAADFPLSLIPAIHKSLSLAKPRSKNRRSQHDFSPRPTLSFVVTRSDLLAPTKEQVDSLMPYFISTLRQALGGYDREIRLGNVHLVSAKRGWWTTDIKDSIWKRGGGNWMVGKVNVGKSNLFEVLFPKGSGERAPSYAELAHDQKSDEAEEIEASPYVDDTDVLSETSLLPPPQPETPFPRLPLVSSLPGTTASPIRLPFGKHKGELIDLPGLARGNLEQYVLPEHKVNLVMTSRPNTSQHIIGPGQSLLIGGGLIRITPILDPTDPSTTLLAYPFIPLDAHVTSTEKAKGTQLQERESGIKTILADGAGERMRLAGKFKLDTDVTRARADTLLAAGVPPDKLAFRVYSTDLLIEGVGWVELVCQVRRRWKQLSSAAESTHSPHSVNEVGNSIFTPFADPSSIINLHAAPIDQGDTPPVSNLSPSTTQESPPPNSTFSSDAEFPIPVVEIYSPNGGHVGKRKPMGAWLLLKPGRRHKVLRAAAGARPRKPMKGAKKREKAERRAREGSHPRYERSD